MPNEFSELSTSKAWHRLVGAAVQAIKSDGYELVRQPGRGRSNVWKMKGEGGEQLVSIRTTRDRWIAFPPMNGGWKTLDDVEVVVVAAVDDADDPKNVEVYMFPADDVRERFTQSYKARIGAGQVVKDNFGMWVCLGLDDRGIPASVGSGLVDHYEPIAVYPLSELEPSDEVRRANTDYSQDARPVDEPRTIADVLSHASVAIASIAGVAPEKVKLDLKIES